MKPKYVRSKVLKVVDGDTLVVKSDRKKREIDLSYIDTAQLVSGEKEYGRIARDWLTGIVQKGDKVDVRFGGGFWSGGSRRQAEVRLAGGDSVAALMIKEGYAFLDDWPDKGYKQLSALERRAMKADKGLWGSWVDMGYSKIERKIRRINRGLADDAPSGGGGTPPPGGGGGTPPPDGGGGGTPPPDGGGGTPPPDGGGGEVQLPFFNPVPSSPGLTDDVKGYINNYNDNIDAYNRFGDCDFISLARDWASFALDDGYSPLAIEFNRVNAFTDCGNPGLII